MDMKYCYEQSILGVYEYFKNYGRLPTIPEWNCYAYQNGYLSTISIRYISKLEFNRWCKYVMTKFDKNVEKNKLT